MKLIIFLSLIFSCFIACSKKDLPVPVSDTVPIAHPDTTKLRLKTYSYLPGNLDKGGVDTFSLIFNRSVKLNRLFFKATYCLPDLKYIIVNNGTTVKFFNFLCGGLGGSYPFQYSVTDSLGNTITDSVTFNCYARKITLAGNPANYFITRDNNYCWVTTNTPNQITCIGIADSSFKKSFNLNFVPNKSIFNYYNNKIYILPSIADYAHRDSIYVMNPNNGIIEKTIYIPRNKSGNWEQFGQELAFGSNGYGMLRISNEYSSSSWLVIDSRINDSIYIHPYVAASITNSNFNMGAFKMCFSNFDQSKIIALEVGGSCRLGILDCYTQSLTELSTPLSPHCYSNYIVVNEVKNDIYMVNLQPTDGQFIISNNLVVGVSTSFDAYNNSEADFSYRQNEKNYIYYLDNYVIGIVDYTTGNILMNTNFSRDLSRISSTTDGKYLLCAGKDCIKIIETKMLYLNL